MKTNSENNAKIWRNALTSLLFLCFLLSGFAQTPKHFERGHTKDGENKKQILIEAKLNEIKKELNLNEKQFKELSAIYMKKEREKDILHRDNKGSKPLNRDEILEMSPQEAQAKIEEDYETGQKLLELHKRYQDEFAKILNPNQILIMEHCERACMHKMREEYKNRKK